jgi:hypothetical protein
MCDRRPRFLQAKQETGHHRIRRGGSQPLISPEAKNTKRSRLLKRHSSCDTIRRCVSGPISQFTAGGVSWEKLQKAKAVPIG